MEIDDRLPRKKSFLTLLRRIPKRISEVVEHFFYRIGYKIATRPWRWLYGSTMIILVCLSGLYFFRQEKDPLRLWVPPDSEFVHDTEWLLAHFEAGIQMQTMMLTADNVLESNVLVKLNEITKQVISTMYGNVSWTDVCLKVPSIAGMMQRNKRSSNGLEDDFFDFAPGLEINQTVFEPAIHADPKLYCGIVNNLPKVCLLYSILDIWDYDTSIIERQTREDIITSINEVTISPTLGHPMNFTNLLGGITRDESGKIISAKAVKTQWPAFVNLTKVNRDQFGNNAGTADWETEDVLMWETGFLNILERNAEALRAEENGSRAVNIWYEAGRSFGDISGTMIFRDVDKLVMGFGLMFVYVLLILSNYNWVELRFCLTVAGLLCVGGAFVIAIGVCSLLRIPYGPVHTSLPFMLLGLGVDDIFIMIGSWRQIHTEESNANKPLPERIGLMLGHAGSAICITSLTDVIAFVIGASTILPSLQSFCIYAAVGVLVTFLLQITYFVGFFSLDTRRIENKKNGVLPCIVHADHVPQVVDPARAISARLISNLYSNFVLTLPGKIVVLLITVAAASAGTVGSLQLQQWFDPAWFVPKETYLSQYTEMRNLHYPDRGYDGFLLMSDVDFHTEFPKIVSLTERLTNLSTIQRTDPWPIHFTNFVWQHFRTDLRKTVLEREDFQNYLSKFLFSRTGGKYQANFQFRKKLMCGETAPEIAIATMDFTFRRFYGPHEWIPAMDESKQVAKEAQIKGFVTVWCRIFSMWVTDKLLGGEVLRNLILALVCVMGMTIVLIAEPQTCIWILLCVLLTLLNVCGFMFFWGLTIDIVSCIALELSIGVSVDYSAHVAHAYLNIPTANGREDRRTRALFAMTHTGAAVACGAGSTLLALSLMTLSDSYLFRSFFKIFFLVILFGLWHGLFFLPVVLSTIGPASLRSHEAKEPRGKIDEAQNESARPLKKEPGD